MKESGRLSLMTEISTLPSTSYIRTPTLEILITWKLKYPPPPQLILISESVKQCTLSHH